MGAVLLSRCRIGSDTIIGARALVTEGTVIPEGVLVLGMPAQARRSLSRAEQERILHSAHHYVQHAAGYGDVRSEEVQTKG